MLLQNAAKKILSFVFIAVMLPGCDTIPKDAFKLTESSMQVRQLQTRRFETTNELSLLSAGASVLQDMGYLIDEIEKADGLITASKDADATDGGQIAGAIVVGLLTGAVTPVDDKQKIRVSFVTIPSHNDTKSYLARITFQRIVWNTQGKVARVEQLKDPETYQGFFDKLSKSVFLEANQL